MKLYLRQICKVMAYGSPDIGRRILIHFGYLTKSQGINGNPEGDILIVRSIMGNVTIVAWQRNGTGKCLDKTVYLTLIFRGYVIIVEVKIGRLIFRVFFTEGIGKHGFELTFYL